MERGEPPQVQKAAVHQILLVRRDALGLVRQVVGQVHRPRAAPVHRIEAVSEPTPEHLAAHTRGDDTLHAAALHGETDSHPVASVPRHRAAPFTRQYRLQHGVTFSVYIDIVLELDAPADKLQRVGPQ